MIRSLNEVETAFIRGALEAGVRFLVVGGHAVNFYIQDHRPMREVKDLDFFYSTDKDNVERLVSYLKSVNVWQPKLTIERLSRPMSVISIGPPVGADLISEITAVPFEEAWQHREMAGETPVISLAHLLENKRASNREQDVEDVKLLDEVEREQPGQRSGG